jgi:hypothetical protein
MKKTGRIRAWTIGVLLLGLLAALVLLYACNLPVTIEKRIELFRIDLNGDRGLVYLNFKPVDPLDYEAIKDSSFWDIRFPVGDGTPYSITALDTDDPANVTGVVAGPPQFVGTHPIEFVMVQEGLDWFIQQLYLDDRATVVLGP